MVQGEGLWVNPVWALPGAPLRPELCGPHPDARSCPQLMGAVPKARLHGEDGQDREDRQAVPLSRTFTFSRLSFPSVQKGPPGSAPLWPLGPRELGPQRSEALDAFKTSFRLWTK